jgi:hypothetical protein
LKVYTLVYLCSGTNIRTVLPHTPFFDFHPFIIRPSPTRLWSVNLTS